MEGERIFHFSACFVDFSEISTDGAAIERERCRERENEKKWVLINGDQVIANTVQISPPRQYSPRTRRDQVGSPGRPGTLT